MNVDTEIASNEEELRKLYALKEEYEEQEKKRMLKSKQPPMAKTKYLLKQEFESSSTKTDQYLEFHRVFKYEFKKLLKDQITNISFHRPNHFDVSGFFTTNNGAHYYFSLGDLRWNKDDLLYRTVKDYKDFTGGRNNFIPLTEIEKLIERIK